MKQRTATDSIHIPTRLKGVRSQMAKSRVPITADSFLSKATSVSNIAVLVSYHP